MCAGRAGGVKQYLETLPKQSVKLCFNIILTAQAFTFLPCSQHLHTFP